ncbi:MAG: acetyl-CoA hydrolase/transferase family protein [Eubacterium sp.]|nr:acetyl-CoA hydrolase/transferase family protein [Candidatus Colimonas fimequi]
MNYQEQYASKLLTVDECLASIKSGDQIFTGLYNVEPKLILSRIHEIVGKVEDVNLWLTNEMQAYPVIGMKEAEGSVNIRSAFLGKVLRKTQTEKQIDFVPNDLHNTIRIINSNKPLTIFMGTCAPMNEDGYFSLGTSCQLEADAIKTADRVILEVNPNSPFTYGDTLVHIDQVDAVVESNEPNLTMPAISASPEDEIIGEYCASIINDGDCIQMGLGGTSTVIGMKLMDKHDLGVHTEIFSDTMLELMKKGAINNSKKTINTGKVTTAFCWGSQELYDFIDHNEEIQFRSSSYVNDPFVIAQNDNLVSINTALQVDLTGQICSESMGSKQFSGAGGALDFAYGAFHSKGGRGIIALNSTAKKGTLSKITPQLTPGAAVTIPRNTADYVITEYGIAHLKGCSLRERALKLIAISHPDFREELTHQAKALGLI